MGGLNEPLLKKKTRDEKVNIAKEQNKKKGGRRRRFNNGINEEITIVDEQNKKKGGRRRRRRFNNGINEEITIGDEQNKKKGGRRRRFHHGIRDEFAKKISEKLSERDISRSEKKNNLIIEKRVDNNGRENKLIKEIEEGIKENDKDDTKKSLCKRVGKRGNASIVRCKREKQTNEDKDKKKIKRK